MWTDAVMANPLGDARVSTTPPLVSETHAAAIGYVAIQWSAVEGALAGLVGHLLKIEGPAARALTDDRSAFAILNMATVLINLSGDTQAISEWGSLSARHEALRPQRNDALHAEWQVSGGNHSVNAGHAPERN